MRDFFVSLYMYIYIYIYIYYCFVALKVCFLFHCVKGIFSESHTSSEILPLPKDADVHVPVEGHVGAVAVGRTLRPLAHILDSAAAVVRSALVLEQSVHR